MKLYIPVILIFVSFSIITAFLLISCGTKTPLGWDDTSVECTEDSECDDGLYCNGEEKCNDGFCQKGESVKCEPRDPVCYTSKCDDDVDACIQEAIGEDNDNDGFIAEPCGLDCDDNNPDVNPRMTELCDNLDNNCDGRFDENLTIACPIFGYQQCEYGNWTECEECVLCIPGTTRYCDDLMYCSWGIQTCLSNSRGWSTCTEVTVPNQCDFGSYLYDEQCCIANGFCCQDFADFDYDGDYDESMGNCTGIICEH